ncbi:hypothetical protein PTKIN_Ptkin07bG0022300 [Pterospermum kingtungense]
MVWSANRDNPVRNRAALKLSENGDLMLQDSDDKLVWNTNTAGKFVSTLNLTEEGNLVLYGRNNEMSLVSGKKTDLNFKCSLIAYIEPDAPQVYFELKTHEPGEDKAVYINGSFGPFVLPSTSASQFIQLGNNGHLRAYQWRESEWKQASDLLINYIGACGFPLVCGEYGLCSDGLCNSPQPEGNETVPCFSNHTNSGCCKNKPVSCKPTDYHSHSLLELKDFDYFNFIPHIQNANREKCTEACLKNCSCKAAIYRQQINSSVGYCSLLSSVLKGARRQAGSRPRPSTLGA